MPLIRLSSVQGLPVIFGSTSLGKVEETALTGDGRALLGLKVRKGLGSARWIPREDILVLGEVSVIVRRKPLHLPQNAGLSLSGVKDSAGLNLGRVTDVLLHRHSLQVAALEISLGLMEEFTFGRMLARHFTVPAAPDEPGQVLIPCGAVLEKPPQPHRKEDAL